MALDPRVTPYATPGLTAGGVPAGGTVLFAAGAPSILPVFLDLPDGWSRAGSSMIVRSPTAEAAPGAPAAAAGLSVSAWVIQDVFAFPCRWSSGVVIEPSLLGTAAGQARALSAWWGQDPGKPPGSNSPIAPVATRPRPTTFADREAWELEVLVLRGFEFDRCDGGQLVLWQTAAGDVRTGSEPGELHRLTVVDLSGTIVVIDAASFPVASVADEATLGTILESIGFAEVR